MSLSDDFKLLGVPRHCPPSEVRAAWRDLASKLHPDKGGSADQFHEARAAYNRALGASLAPRICEACRGVGKPPAPAGFGTLPMRCRECRGSGKIYPV